MIRFMQDISAKLGTGVSDLLKPSLSYPRFITSRANPNKLATGTVIEAKLDKGRGPVTTLLVQGGTLHTGDALVVGTAFGKVRKMTMITAVKSKGTAFHTCGNYRSERCTDCR